MRSPRERGKLRRKSSDKRIPLLDAKEDTPTKASKPKAKTIKKVGAGNPFRRPLNDGEAPFPPLSFPAPARAAFWRLTAKLRCVVAVVLLLLLLLSLSPPRKC